MGVVWELKEHVPWIALGHLEDFDMMSAEIADGLSGDRVAGKTREVVNILTLTRYASRNVER